MTIDLSTPVQNLYLVGPTYARRLRRLEIETVEDLLCHFPFRYEDYSLISKIGLVQPGEKVTIQGIVKEIKNEYTKRGKKIQKAVVADETGEIGAVWYNQPFLIKNIHRQDQINLSGEVNWFGHTLILETPQYEVLKPGYEAIHTGRLVPIYPETGGVTSKWLRSRIAPLLRQCVNKFIEYLPYSIIRGNNLLDFAASLRQIHFPQDRNMAKLARERLAFDELLFIQLSSLIRKAQWQKEVVGNKFQISNFQLQIQDFFKKLPFLLTKAQRRCVSEILTDLGSVKPMNRLLQGDVGSGKTVVAAIAMYLAYLNGYQSALMAPTEILANQHYQTLKSLLEPFGLRIKLITSSCRHSGLSRIDSGVGRQRQPPQNDNIVDLFVGTHALLNEKIPYQKLGLVVIDEQHRFGVEQRTTLREKGINPHLLTLTATPIPRSVSLTLYGELDLSYIDEMPKGRLKVKTWLVPGEKRPAAYEWIKKQLKSDQAFIICPLIEESLVETMRSVKAAATEYQRLQKEIFPKFQLGLLHGRLKSKEKERVLGDFRQNKLEILVATPVVEVGIDIPNATIMMIEAAERFGLAQLHQLRGRVGRREKQSYCLLFSESDKSQNRLKALETIYNGAELSELDLKLRGPGEVFGIRQHGFLNLKVASLTDYVLIDKAKKAAGKILRGDPGVTRFPLLQEKLKKYTIKKVAPD